MKKAADVGSSGRETLYEEHNLHARELFSVIAPEYDFISRVFSLGRDPAWKRQLINWLPSLSTPTCVDLASGTGDLTFALAEKYPAGSILGIDITPQMIHIATCRNMYKNITWHLGDMCKIPLEDNSVDIITGGYALWRAHSQEALLSELRRVLKPGGIVVFLDVCKPYSTIGQCLQYAVLKIWGTFWSLMLHGACSVYTHLVDDLFSQPTLAEFAMQLKKSGFVKMHTKRVALGMVVLLTFEKHR